MPSFANITIEPRHISFVPGEYKGQDTIPVDVDAQVHDTLGTVIIESIRFPNGQNAMLTTIGKDEVKAEIQERSKRRQPRGMNELQMNASVERGMFG